MKYDVIIVGARCGGASTAMLLARKGYRVLLTDRAAFPSEIPHGHFIHRGGPQRLHRWGLLDRVLASGCPQSTTFALDLGSFALVAREMTGDGAPFGCGPRRRELDRILVEAAVEAGAELRESFVIDAFESDGTRLTGIRGRSRGAGPATTEQATVTVGADGRGSLLARTVGAETYNAVPTLTCWQFSYWADVPATGLEVYPRPQRVILAFPTHGDLLAVFVGWPIGEQRTVQADIEGEFMKAVGLAPGLAGRLAAGRRAERFYGAANLPNFMRRPYGPGWALVGDAGCHKDPYLALGISDALRDAGLLADALDEWLSGRQSEESAMAGYEESRNALGASDYQDNLNRARLAPPPAEEVRLLMSLQGNQEGINRFFMARQGLMPA